MKLLITLITYDRLAYTKQTLRNLWDSASDEADYFLVVVDNNSTDGTKEYLQTLKKRHRVNHIILNEDNYYPGKACNIGWEYGVQRYNPTHLMRLDNDMSLEKNWDIKVKQYFKAIPELGQLGIDHEAIEHPKADLHRRSINGYMINEWPGCVGGPCIVPRKVWDMGLRWPEMRWDDERQSAVQEDSTFSKLIMNAGFLVGHTQIELGRTFATKDNWNDYKDYYLKTMSDRGYEDVVKHIKELK
jgi:glycosyltransferase involved in cell wall biosynthesis